MTKHTRFDSHDKSTTAEPHSPSVGAPAPAASFTKPPTEKKWKTATTHSNISKYNNNSYQNRGRSKNVSSQIRSLERLLKNRGSTLPPKVLAEKKQQLEQLQRLTREQDRRHRERDVSKKYHMVRFFERRKLQRILDGIERSGNKPQDLECKQQALRDLKYVTRFPKGRKYISLFPKDGHSEEACAKVAAIREEIENGAVNNPLLATAHVQEEQGPDGEPADAGNDEAQDDFFLDDAGDKEHDT